MGEKLKREFIELLERDKEFRYIVAGYLGLSEVLKRLDKLSEHSLKLGERVAEMEERFEKRFLKLEERIAEMEERFEKRFLRLGEDIRRLYEGQERIWKEIEKLHEGQKRIWENIERLYEGQERLWEEVRSMRITLDRLSRTVDRLALSEEEEARSVIRYRLREEMGIDIKLGRVFVDGKEINVYGTVEDLCVIGEVSVRAGTGLVEELEEKVKLIEKEKPELLRPKIIKALYTLYATPDAIERAKELGIWLLKWDKDYTPRIVHKFL